MRSSLLCRAVLVWLLGLMVILTAACSPPPEQLADPDRHLPEIIQDGIPIPRFSTAEDQLNYARSGLFPKKRKLAALRAVAALFPENRPECGQAAMGLAYLHLEPEYRFASPLEIQQATNDFFAVLKMFSDLPAIRAKALWYLGWIHTELKSDPTAGMTFYWQVVNELASVPMNLSPTAPWVNLVYPARSNQKPGKEPGQKSDPPASPKRYWAQVALLEIVRNSPDTVQAQKACDLLVDRYPASQATGLALKHMLAHPDLAGHALPASARYLSLNPKNPYLARDIQNLAEAVVP